MKQYETIEVIKNGVSYKLLPIYNQKGNYMGQQLVIDNVEKKAYFFKPLTKESLEQLIEITGFTQKILNRT